MSKMKYFGAFLTPLLAYIAFNVSGIFAYTGVFVLYILVPVLEQLLPQNTYNLSKEKLAEKTNSMIGSVFLVFFRYTCFDF